MAGDRYVFDGLDGFEKRLRRVAAEVDYLVAWDRTDRATEDPLGRFELTLNDALPYLEGAEELSETEPSDDDLVDDDPYGDDAPPHEPEDDATRAERLLGRTPGPADFAVAAARWLRDLAARNMAGEGLRRFRVKAYSPKGARVVETCTFACRDDDAEPMLPAAVPVADPPALDLRIPTPTFEQVETFAASRGMKALGDFYAQWGQIVLGSVGQLQQVNNGMLGRMHRDLQQSRDQVDQLIAAILNLRVTEAELADERAAASRSDDTRAALAQQALQQVGEAARAFLAAKGMAPEMAETVGAIGQSPELVATLQDPDVRVLMRDPANLKMLADMLKHAAQHARSLRDAPLAKAS